MFQPVLAIFSLSQENWLRILQYVLRAHTWCRDLYIRFFFLIYKRKVICGGVLGRCVVPYGTTHSGRELALTTHSI